MKTKIVMTCDDGMANQATTEGSLVELSSYRLPISTGVTTDWMTKQRQRESSELLVTLSSDCNEQRKHRPPNGARRGRLLVRNGPESRRCQAMTSMTPTS